MSPAKVIPLIQRLRSLTPDRQIEAIALDVDGIRHDVDGLRVLASAGVEAQRATGDALALMADRIGSMSSRLEAVELGVFESLELARRAEARARDAMASDIDLAQTVEREKAAREAEAQRTREALAPVLADVSRRAGNAGAAKAGGVLTVGSLAVGLAAQPVETIKLLREIGPTGAGIAVVLLLVAVAWARRRRS